MLQISYSAEMPNDVEVSPMANKPVIVCLRHPVYSMEVPYIGGITEEGKSQAREVALRLIGIFQNVEEVRVLSSPSVRALEGAKIIADMLTCGMDQSKYLLNSPPLEFHPKKFWRQLVDGRMEGDLIVLIAHALTVASGSQEIGRMVDQPWPETTEPGFMEGWIIELETETYGRFTRER